MKEGVGGRRGHSGTCKPLLREPEGGAPHFASTRRGAAQAAASRSVSPKGRDAPASSYPDPRGGGGR